jgi:hypothetical protein
VVGVVGRSASKKLQPCVSFFFGGVSFPQHLCCHKYFLPTPTPTRRPPLFLYIKGFRQIVSYIYKNKMTDDFATRVRTLLAENPRICGFGCNTMEQDHTARISGALYRPKTRDGFGDISDAQIERFRKMVAFIQTNLPAHAVGRHSIGSYGFKHVLERNHWTDDNDKYVSNGEGIVAMMLAGHKPRWSDDRTNPNCNFLVKAKNYRVLCETAEQPRRTPVGTQVSAGQ